MGKETPMAPKPSELIHNREEAEAMARANEATRKEMTDNGFDMNDPEDRKHVEWVATGDEGKARYDYETERLKSMSDQELKVHVSEFQTLIKMANRILRERENGKANELSQGIKDKM